MVTTPSDTTPPDPPAPADHPARWLVRNETPRPVWLEHAGRILSLAPHEERSWSAEPGPPGWAQPADVREAFPQLRRLIDRRQVTVSARPEGPARDPQLTGAARATLIIACGWPAALWPLPLWWWLRLGAALAIGCALWFLVLLSQPARRERRRTALQARGTGGQVRRWTFYNFTMVAVVAIGILMPAAALYLATDLHDVVTFWPEGFSLDLSQPLPLIGRLMQLTFIAVATLMPALMYFQFDAERLGTLRNRWIQNVFRLDPTVSTTSDVQAKYERQLEEAYGLDDGRGRLTRGRRSPIIVTTLILAFGWLLIMLRAGERIEVGPDGSLSFVALLSPDQSLVTFAFLGAYFFGLHLIWQGYVRSDLRPKAYTTIAVRILVVVVLAWLIEAVTDAGTNAQPLFLIAFAAGFVPDKVLHLLWERVLPRKVNLFAFDQQQPLTEIEGIDLYERTRLSEEGITNVEALAHHDLLDLFFKTRFPAARLVDWVDQAILVMYLNGNGRGETPARPRGNACLRAALRRVGIRTATDLVEFTRRTHRETAEASRRRVADLAGVLMQVLPADEHAGLERRLQVLSEALDHSEWLGRIENWRRSDLIEPNPCKRRHIDGKGDLRYGDPRFSRIPARTAKRQRTHRGTGGAVLARRHRDVPRRRRRRTERTTSRPGAGPVT
jgi:hypothetical protein